jgi:hypothetical protein
MKDDGTFIFADFRLATTIDKLETQIKKYFDIKKKHDIGLNVARSLELNTNDL